MDDRVDVRSNRVFPRTGPGSKVTFVENVVNQKVEPAAFSFSSLGVQRGDNIDDRRTGQKYQFEGEQLQGESGSGDPPALAPHGSPSDPTGPTWTLPPATA